MEKNLDRTKKLIKTIDKTIKRLRGKQKMEDKELYTGFDMAKQREYEKYLVQYKGTVAEDLLFESKQRSVDWGSQEWEAIKDEGNAIYKAVADCIDRGLGPRDEEVQAQVELHVQMIGRLYTVSKDVYIGLSQLYCEHEDFRKFFDPIHPELVEFFAEAMRFFAQKNL